MAAAVLIFGGLESATPGENPQVLEIDTANVSSFQAGFNRSSRSARLVLLLSPT